MKCKYKGCNNPVRYKKKRLCNSHYMMEYRGKTEAGYNKRICEGCGDEYKPCAPNQKYCENCKYENKLRINKKCYLKKRNIFVKVCERCGNTFETSRNFQKICGEECRQKYNLEQKIEYYYLVVKPKHGHLDRGQSYPQKYIFDIINDEFDGLEWKYDDRSVIKNPETNYPLELDIWCPSKKVAIEYDGEHHFSSKQYGKDKFLEVKKLDSIKNNLCKENNIKLLRIAYFDDWKNENWIIERVGELINGDN